MRIQNWIFEFPNRSFLLARWNWYGLDVNFCSTWSKQTWHILNPSVNKKTWKTNSNCKAVLLFTDCLFRKKKSVSLGYKTEGLVLKENIHKKKTALERSSIRKDMVKSSVLLGLEETTKEWGNISEITEMHEDERWEIPERHPDGWYPGLVTVSRTMAWSCITCCPTFPVLPGGRSSWVYWM